MITSQHVLYASGYASADQAGIHGCIFDDVTGYLTVHGSFAGIVNPPFLSVHPNGRWLYAVSETSQQKDSTPGAVWALRLTREPWSMEPINHQMSGGDLPCHLDINATGQWVLVSNYGSGTVGVLPILQNGALGETCNGYLDHPFKNKPLETEKDLLRRLANTAGLVYNPKSSPA